MSCLHQGSFPHREEGGLTVKGSLRRGVEQSHPLCCIYESKPDLQRHVLDYLHCPRWGHEGRLGIAGPELMHHSPVRYAHICFPLVASRCVR